MKKLQLILDCYEDKTELLAHYYSSEIWESNIFDFLIFNNYKNK
jgi:hypothetical protein